MSDNTPAFPPPPGSPEQPGYGQVPPAPPGYTPAPAPGYGMPPMGMPSAPAGPVVRPKAMDQAVMLMRVGAVLAVLGLLVSLTMRDSYRAAVEKALSTSGETVDPAMVDAAVSASVTMGTIFGLLGAGLWLWMASANGKGRSWARIVATVFFGIALLSTAFSLTQGSSPMLSTLLGLASLAVGAGALFFMYRPESSQYYAAVSRPQSMY